MSERLFTLKNRWFTGSVAALAATVVVAGAIGFVWVPRAHEGDALATIWDSICSAAGAPARYRNAALQDDKAAFPSSVIVNARMMGEVEAASVGHGATLALQCSMCHGARVTASAGTGAPHLAAQPRSATYKQLRDFKSGHRASAVMQPMASNLNEQDMRDLAAFYATQQRDTLVAHAGVRVEVPRLVSNGSPMRNIGACASCHAPAVGRAATPVLDGLPAAYIRDQLSAFRAGRRANDINEQMRNVARQLTDQEIALIAAYYASR